MPPLRKLLDPRGTKIAYLILAFVANVAWALFFFSIVDTLMRQYGNLISGVDITLMLGIFFGTFFIGFIVAMIARDGRGLTYGIYGGLAGLIVVLLATWNSGLLAALVGATAVLGGYNGGSLGEVSRRRRTRP